MYTRTSFFFALHLTTLSAVFLSTNWKICGLFKSLELVCDLELWDAVVEATLLVEEGKLAVGAEDGGDDGDVVPGGGLVAPLRGSLGVEDDVKIVVVDDGGG